MKRYIMLFSLFIALAGCTAQNNWEKANPKEFKSKYETQKSPQLIDVRTPQEYSAGHLAGAKNINIHDADFEKKIAELDKDEPVYVYCQMGGRSTQAAKKLKEKGVKNVVELEGGYAAWSQVKLPTEK